MPFAPPLESKQGHPLVEALARPNWRIREPPGGRLLSHQPSIHGAARMVLIHTPWCFTAEGSELAARAKGEQLQALKGRNLRRVGPTVHPGSNLLDQVSGGNGGQ